ncbi:MAG TPA: efflux RND transporter periplasmic adaptor subunit [Anaerolineales bacterium]|nr:efflux RND transporter periplasmic adaptor subunit [Anaerolineales bacterium]
MKKNHLIACTVVALALTLAACGASTSPTAIPTVVLNSQPVAASNTVSASGQVVPVQKVQLSFPLTGVAKTVEVKAGDSVTAGQTLITLDTTLLAANVAEAQANVAAAQAQVDYLRRVGTTSQEDLDGAQAQVDKAQALLDSAQATLAEATLTAPFNGTVAEVDLSPAETVVPGQIVVVMGDLTKFQIETTDLSERDAPNVKVGQTAAVSISALNQKFTGRVSDVARISTTVGGDVVYKVTIQLDTQPQGLLWGMTTDVTIQTGN